MFSTCSKKDLAASLEKGVGMCLYNMPEVKVLYGGQKCGNGYVEEGEECDCGEPEVRSETFSFFLFVPAFNTLLSVQLLLQKKHVCFTNEGGKNFFHFLYNLVEVSKKVLKVLLFSNLASFTSHYLNINVRVAIWP